MIDEAADELAARARIREVIDDARERVEAIVEPAIPTASFLAALAEELAAATRDPSSAEYPELVDPDAYWEAAVKPQSRSVKRSVGAVLEYAETHIAGQVAAAEVELGARVDQWAGTASPDDPMARGRVIDEIANECQSLHHLVAQLIGVLPPRDELQLAHDALDEARRQKAITDVEALKPVYLREAGGDEEHQRYAEQQWSETFADRVSHRDMLLRGEVPWRHQELAIVGQERTRDQLSEMVDAVVARLQQPLLEVGARLVRRYDAFVVPWIDGA